MIIFIKTPEKGLNNLKEVIKLASLENQKISAFLNEKNQHFYDSIEVISHLLNEITLSSNTIGSQIKEEIKNFELYSITLKNLISNIDHMNNTVNKLLNLYTSTKSEANIGKNLLKDLKNMFKEIDQNSEQIIKIAKFILDISNK